MKINPKSFAIILILSVIQLASGFLFNIVGIPNEACMSQDGKKTGICMSGDDCAGRGGKYIASCALGLGTCCEFSTQACGGTISQNCTHVQNDGFPVYSSRSGILCDWILDKTDDICFIRLDFKTFRVAGPQFDTRALGNCAVDYLQLNEGNGNKNINLCGTLTGQHIYLEPGRGGGTVTTMSIYQATDSIGIYRNFDIKVSQIPCDSNYTPDSGCRMYYTGIKNNLKTLNFDGDQRFHLNDMNFNMCIRQELGYCGIKYFPTDEQNSFSISGQQATASVGVFRCRQDYVYIPGVHNKDYSCTVAVRDVKQKNPSPAVLPSSLPYFTGGSNTLNVQRVQRICGNIFSCIHQGTKNEELFTRTKPFVVSLVVDENEFNFPNDAYGFSLNYTQLECADQEI